MSEPRPKARRASYTEALSFGALSFVAVALIGVVGSIVIARIYGIQVMGEAALVLAPGLALALLSSFREQAALVRKLSTLPARAPAITGLTMAVMAFSTLLTTAAATIVAVGTYVVFNGPVDQPDLILPALANLLAYIVVGNTGWNMDMVLSAFRAGRQLFWIRLYQAITFLVLAVAFGLVWGSVWGLVLATAGSYALAVVHRLFVLPPFMLYRVPFSEIRAGFRELPGMIRFSLKLGPGQMANGLSDQCSVWILGVTGSIAAVGAWNRAQQLSVRLAGVGNRTTEVLLPTLVERRERGDHDGFDRSLVESVRYTFVVLLLAGSAGAGGSFGVMELFGPGFTRAADALSIMVLLPAIASVTSILSICLIAEDRPGKTAMISIGRMVVTFAGVTLGSIEYGITGAAAGLMAGLLFSLVLHASAARQYLSRPVLTLWPAGEIIALALASVAGFGVARIVDLLIPGVGTVVIALAAGVAAFAATFSFAGGLNARDRERVQGLAGRLRRPLTAVRPPKEGDLVIAAEAMDFTEQGFGFQSARTSWSRMRQQEVLEARYGRDEISAVNIARLRRFVRLVGAPILITCAAAVGYAWFQAPTYTAESRLSVSSTGVDPGTLARDLAGTSSQAAAYGRLADSDAIVSRVAGELGSTPATTRRRLAAAPIPGTTILVVEATGRDADAAVDLANVASLALIDEVEALGENTEEQNRLLGAVAAAQGEVTRAQGEATRLSEQFEAAPSPTTRSQLSAAESALTAGRLVLAARQEEYRRSTTAVPDAPELQVLNPARSARSDAADILLQALMWGAAIGLLLGLLAWVIRGRRMDDEELPPPVAPPAAAPPRTPKLRTAERGGAAARGRR